MCERYSWIEKDGKVLFLTPADVFDTDRGKAMQKWNPRREDWHGHGAIRWFYKLTGGTDRECTDFRTPNNFPPDLAEAIRDGRMWRFGITDEMLAMLTRKALAVLKQTTAWAKLNAAQAKLDAARDERQLAVIELFAGLWKVRRNRIKAWR